MLNSQIISKEGCNGRVSGEEVAVFKKIIVLNGYVLRHCLCSVRKLFLVGSCACLAYPLLLGVVFIYVLEVTYGYSAAACISNEVAYYVAIVNVVFKVYSQISCRLKSAVYEINVMRG